MFSITVLCNHFAVQAEIESYSGRRVRSVNKALVVQDGGDVYVIS